METKTCTECNRELPKTEEYFKPNFDKRRNKSYLSSKCRCCIRYEQKIYRDNLSNERKVIVNQYKLKYAHSAKGKDSSYRFSKTEKFKKIQKKYQSTSLVYKNYKSRRDNTRNRKKIEELHNDYIKNMLSLSLNIPYKELTLSLEIINVKKQQLKLYRLCHIQNN